MQVTTVGMACLAGGRGVSIHPLSRDAPRETQPLSFSLLPFSKRAAKPPSFSPKLGLLAKEARGWEEHVSICVEVF